MVDIGSELKAIKRPRDGVIRSRILKCQYKIDDTVGPEAKVSCKIFNTVILF